MEDRSWIARRKVGGFITPEFVHGVRGFLEFALSHPEFMDGDMIKCPCCRCKNRYYLSCNEVEMHLINRGFIDGYNNWFAHGELLIPNEVINAFAASSSSSNMADSMFDNVGSIRGMVMDIMPFNDPYFYPGF